MSGEAKICGTCRLHVLDKSDFSIRYSEFCRSFKDFICANSNSEYLDERTEYSHTCDEWEGRG